MSTKLLTVKNLKTAISGKKILKNLNLNVAPGELHVLMGPNGSGKSTFAYALLGHPNYKVQAEKMLFNGNDIQTKSTDERARLGIFLGFQYPLAISGVSLANLLPMTLRKPNKKNGSKKILFATLAAKMAHEQKQDTDALRDRMSQHLSDLRLHEDIVYRNVNEGFSGGEKKKAEILQMLAIEPKLAILDEPDSGLDIDAVKAIARAIDTAHKKGIAIILITHYQRILKYLKPDRIHILMNGRIVTSGGPELARKIEKQGYEKVTAIQ